MSTRSPILLFIGDRPVLSSLEFALALEGFDIVNGAAEEVEVSSAGCLVVDQGYCGDGAAFLAELRQDGHAMPAILLVTNPTASTRTRAGAAGAVVIEKPLFGEELTHALRGALDHCEAA
ncbi:response regulator transcription factor [Pelagerythrobacter aerophilus]|uniref:Response regulator n=1 Tax=Pelagerythrobacter aerophilus TaxID=2306995 RepID=A0A418NEA8_9SPHN|nr:response regulator [Pelagerythrobacter aerophilus]RIV76668.1 response regulator [Pelagerythrobacter aerophilus]